MRPILFCLAGLMALAGLGCDERLPYGLLQEYGFGGFGGGYDYGYSDYGYGGEYVYYDEPIYYETPYYEYDYYDPCGYYDSGCW